MKNLHPAVFQMCLPYACQSVSVCQNVGNTGCLFEQGSLCSRSGCKDGPLLSEKSYQTQLVWLQVERRCFNFVLEKLSALHADLQSMRIEEMNMRKNSGEDVSKEQLYQIY